MAGCLQGWISIGFQRQVLSQVGVIKKESPVTPKRQGFFEQAERALYHPYQSLALSRAPSFGKTGPYVRCGLFVLACAPGDRSANLRLAPPHKRMRSYYTRCETKATQRKHRSTYGSLLKHYTLPSSLCQFGCSSFVSFLAASTLEGLCG